METCFSTVCGGWSSEDRVVTPNFCYPKYVTSLNRDFGVGCSDLGFSGNGTAGFPKTE